MSVTFKRPAKPTAVIVRKIFLSLS